MTDHLKRIEEKHRECLGCDLGEDESPRTPCDVVKLARALDDAAKALRANRCQPWAEDAERTLAEVAGEEPQEEVDGCTCHLMQSDKKCLYCLEQMDRIIREVAGVSDGD